MHNCHSPVLLPITIDEPQLKVTAFAVNRPPHDDAAVFELRANIGGSATDEITLPVYPTDTIAYIQGAIWVRSGIFPNQQIIQYHGRQLDISCTLAHHSIHLDACPRLEVKNAEVVYACPSFTPRGINVLARLRKPKLPSTDVVVVEPVAKARATALFDWAGGGQHGSPPLLSLKAGAGIGIKHVEDTNWYLAFDAGTPQRSGLVPRKYVKITHVFDESIRAHLGDDAPPRAGGSTRPPTPRLPEQREPRRAYDSFYGDTRVSALFSLIAPSSEASSTSASGFATPANVSRDAGTGSAGSGTAASVIVEGTDAALARLSKSFATPGLDNAVPVSASGVGGARFNTVPQSPESENTPPSAPTPASYRIEITLNLQPGPHSRISGAGFKFKLDRGVFTATPLTRDVQDSTEAHHTRARETTFEASVGTGDGLPASASVGLSHTRKHDTEFVRRTWGSITATGKQLQTAYWVLKEDNGEGGRHGVLGGRATEDFTAMISMRPEDCSFALDVTVARDNGKERNFWDSHTHHSGEQSVRFE